MVMYIKYMHAECNNGLFRFVARSWIDTVINLMMG